MGQNSSSCSDGATPKPAQEPIKCAAATTADKQHHRSIPPTNNNQQTAASEVKPLHATKTYKLGVNNGLIDASEISVHNSEQSCWLVIHGMVYDVTRFLEDHPGGPDLLLDFGGVSEVNKDATREFENVRHSQVARDEMHRYLIGQLSSSSQQENE